jgi:hypothetical protein
MYVCMCTSKHIYRTYTHTHTQQIRTMSSRFCTRHKDYAAYICKLCCYWSSFTRRILHFFESKVTHVNNSYISDVVYQLLLWGFILESSDERGALCGLHFTNVEQNWINILVFWAMTACSVANDRRRIGRTCCVHSGRYEEGGSKFLRVTPKHVTT